MTPVSLPDVTVVIVDTVNYGGAINAIQKTLAQITPAKVLFFTDIEIDVPGAEVIQIDRLTSKKAYSDLMMKSLGQYPFETSHLLVIQHDGYVLDGTQWTDEFLQYDYIGAPWLEQDGFNVGNGGFSLRSVHLHVRLWQDPNVIGIQPEDVGICRIYRNLLEQKYGIVFCPEPLAHKFSYELHEPHGPTFGFHGKFHPKYSEPLVIKRSGALGDVIQVEPVLEYFNRLGHKVYLDTDPRFYTLFAHHYFPVHNYATFDKEVIQHRVINLDMAYEVYPQLPHIEAYFKVAGIKGEMARNAKLFYPIDDSNRMFKKYAVIHIDERETTHRNIHGVRWSKVLEDLNQRGYLVFQIGKNNAPSVGIRFNTVNEMMMKWLIAGAELFIGVDSGPSHIAVALGIRSVIFFGSVNPRMIHMDFKKIVAVQSACTIGKDHCWHAAPGTRGQDCEVDKDLPPCTLIETDRVIGAIAEAVTL